MITKLNEAMQAYAKQEATMEQLAEIQTWALGASFARGQLKAAARRAGIDGTALIAEVKAHAKALSAA